MAARGRSLAAIDRDPDVTQAEQVIRALGGTGVEAAALRPVSGGCIHQAWWAELADGSSRFVKASVTAPEDAFEREAEGLAALGAVGAIRVPREVVAGEGEGVRFLVMEAISTGAPPPGFFADFGRRFAELHRGSRSERFGFPHDNYLGATPQPNGWETDWARFFARHRLGHQLALARRRGLAGGGIDRLGDRLLERLDDLLDVAGEPACLLHGDLWSGNFLVDERGAPVLVDPACYYGHREADLAMTRLFGGFAPDFYAAYEEAWPLPAGSAERLPVYTLYHLLNHLNLFGDAYRERCVSVLERLV
jgi:fructosamine-3-kinase